MTRVIEAMPALDPTLEGAARSTLGRMQHDLQTLRSKTIQAAKKRDETLRRQFTRTRALVFPGGDRRNARSDSCRSSTSMVRRSSKDWTSRCRSTSGSTGSWWCSHAASFIEVV